MGPKPRKPHKISDHRKSQQNAAHRFSSDVDDSIRAANQSSDAETFPASYSDKLRDQLEDQRLSLDMTHDLSEAGSTVSCMQHDLNVSSSASEINTDESGALSCQNLKQVGKVSSTKEDELNSDASIEAAVSCSCRQKLMQQIDSLLRDSEIIAPHRSEFRFEACELKHPDVPELNFKLETGPETPELSATYVGIVTKDVISAPCDGAQNKVCQGQDAEKLSEVRPLSNLAKGEFSLALADNECLEEFLRLLHQLSVICCKSVHQQHLSLSTVHQNDDNPQIDRDGVDCHGDRRDKDDTLSVPTEVDDSENSKQAKEDEIRKLLLSISKVLERNQFSSAVELAEFLEVVEQMKVAIDQRCHIQNKIKTASSRDNKEQTAFDSASGGVKSVNEALSVLRTKPSHILTQLSNSLVLWQDFIETRAELEHELALEQCLLDSIHTDINCIESPRTKLEVERDLELVEDKLEDYSEKLMSLRMCNRQLAEILDHSAISSNRSQTGILAGKLQSIKDSCLSLRRMLAAPGPDEEALSSSWMTSEPTNSLHLLNAQVENSAEDFDKLNIAHLVMKMMLLLFLIILLLLFVSYFEPHLYHPLNQFRLPVPIHVRHVGTYPPM